ncbi:unnamed protein product [Rangifer tarandus platyrhynchus]|uniref:Uncharacterized protein n=2 Tax=Rangifer tarandus platyrhynchus TaxID=3082113 RepID=A0ABN9A034_RANTA|nr:unnamed protein product [Rangifer tarandus platyrhynchus]CAI9713683.1 unnamed protein product [Rangifer tarandus platyrhynchus]
MRGPGGLPAFPLPCALGGQTDGVPGLNSCCQGVRGTASPALVAGTLVHSCVAALRGWGAVGALRKAGPSPQVAAACVQGCAFQSRRCLGRAQGRKAGASEGAVTPLGCPGFRPDYCTEPKEGLVWSPRGGEGRCQPRSLAAV